MGYYMEQFDQAFRISAENKAAAFEALKSWALKEMERNAAYAHLGHSPIGDATELEDALSELDWETSTDDCGNIVGMCFSGEKIHDEDEWLDAIAPHVDKGSQLMMRGEDGCSWCWYFDGESCTTYSGEVIIPDGIQVIGNVAFDGVLYYENISRFFPKYKTITSVYIPDTVTVISDYAFQYLVSAKDGLHTVRMSSNIEYIGKAAFASNHYLEKVTFDALPEHTVRIADEAFCYCESLTEITLPDSVLMGKDVFISTPFEETYSALYGTLPEEETEPVEVVPPVLSPEDMVLVPEIITTPEDDHLWD